MTQPTPLTEQQLDDITAIATRAADDPFYVSDCEGSLQVWREKALVHVRRDESGVIDMYSFPSTYKATDQIIELDLSTWDPGEDATDDQQRQDIRDLVEARAALGVLLAEIDRARAALTEMTHCRDDVETDIDLEETIAAPFYGPGWDWDEADVQRVVSVVVAAIRPAFGKLTQERDQLRSELAAEAGQAEAMLDRVQRIARRLAAHAVGFGDVLDESDRGPWGRTVGADIAELAAAFSPDTAPAPTTAPLAASQPSEAPVEGETATRTSTGRLRDSGAGAVGGGR